MAKAIMIQGTMSNAGKSLIAAGLCRIFKQDGYRVAPFKSQNMALNSYITDENLEMGRAQVVQAKACGIAPKVCMNPILLKPTTDMGSQVIVNGRVLGNMRAMDYFRHKKDYIPAIMEAYRKLAEEYDIIVIEGAGSPAEINLKQDDIVNMGMAKMADAPVLLVGDIDRGGVFAQLVGTVMLLEEEEKDRIKGLIINKFRGDRKILEPGLDMLTEACGKKVLGVVPYAKVDIEEEDSLAEQLDKREITVGGDTAGVIDIAKVIDIAVIRLPKISNFTDFQAFSIEQAVSVRYVEKLSQLGNPDLIILPGTKNTIQDMRWLRESGLEGAILRRVESGSLLFGICGGYQMLGQEITDESGQEGRGSIKGMGLLPIVTAFAREKTCTRVEGAAMRLEGAFSALSGKKVNGYEIHMGESRVISDKDWTGESGQAFSQVALLNTDRAQDIKHKSDGYVCGNVAGTYLHGVFDEEEFRRALVGLLCERKGIAAEPDRSVKRLTFEEYQEAQYDKLADILRESLDMKEIYRILEEGMHGA